MAGTLILGISLALVGLVIVALGIASKMERLPINSLIGLRTPSIMSDPETWTRAHKAAWVWTTVSGVGLMVAGVVVLATQDESGIWAMAGTAWLLLFIIIATIVASREAKSSHATFSP